MGCAGTLDATGITECAAEGAAVTGALVTVNGAAVGLGVCFGTTEGAVTIADAVDAGGTCEVEGTVVGAVGLTTGLEAGAEDAGGLWPLTVADMRVAAFSKDSTFLAMESRVVVNLPMLMFGTPFPSFPKKDFLAGFSVMVT